MNNIIKTAIIGCGNISYNHLVALKPLENVKITALCDIIPERAEKRKAEFSLSDAKIYTSFEELLENEELDAIHIATPHYLHAPMTIASLERGINVFLEKPMCISREQIAAMLEAEKKSTARVCVSFQNRFSAPFVKALSIAEEDGGAVAAYGSVFWYRGEEYYTLSGWRGTYEKEGGGVMINQAIHTLDMLCHFLGTPKKLWATKSKHHIKDVLEVEDSCEGLIEFENGKQANFYATSSCLAGDSTVLYVKTKNHKIEVRNYILYVDGNRVDTTKTTVLGKECYGDGHPTVIKMFYEAILDGSPMPISLESAQYAVRILLAAYESEDRETLI